jgi:hypothetical protein
MYITSYIAKNQAGGSTSCQSTTWRGPALQLQTYANPALFIVGRVLPGVRTVLVQYANGATQTLHPTDGYILTTIPPTSSRTERRQR